MPAKNIVIALNYQVFVRMLRHPWGINERYYKLSLERSMMV